MNTVTEKLGDQAQGLRQHRSKESKEILLKQNRSQQKQGDFAQTPQIGTKQVNFHLFSSFPT